MESRSAERPASAGHRQRLRERFEQTGFAGFAEHEVLELILTLAIPRQDVKPRARALLDAFGSLRAVLEASPDQLRAIPGIGKVTPVALRIIREAAGLYLQQGLAQADAFRSIQQIEDFWRHRLGGLDHEVIDVAFTDSAHRLLPNGVDRVEEGDLDSVVLSPRRILEAAVRRRASGIILVHNHPNGDPQPTPADRALTTALVRAAEPLGIRLLDHLIVGRASVYSFRRAGLLEPLA